jgi:hypothetical protein
VSIDGIEVWPASPLALYRLRIGIASQGSFGELNEKQRASLRRLKESSSPIGRMRSSFRSSSRSRWSGSSLLVG